MTRGISANAPIFGGTAACGVPVRLGTSSHGRGGEKRILASRHRFHHKEKAGRESMTGADGSSVVFIGTLGRLPT